MEFVKLTDKQAKGLRVIMLRKLSEFYGGFLGDTTIDDKFSRLDDKNLEIEFKKTFKIVAERSYFGG